MPKNRDFEEGSYIFPNMSCGVLVPPIDEDDYTPLSPWTVLSSTKSIKYVNAAHYKVPRCGHVVELLSGMKATLA
jgi:hypothetical protein